MLLHIIGHRLFLLGNKMCPKVKCLLVMFRGITPTLLRFKCKKEVAKFLSMQQWVVLATPTVMIR